MSRRGDQIASVLRREVQAVISRGFQDPRIRGLITVTDVELADSGRRAVVRVSVLPEERESLTMHGLKGAAKHIRHEVGDRVALRHMPELVIELDRGLKKQAAIYEALAQEDALTDRPDSDADASPEDGSEP